MLEMRPGRRLHYLGVNVNVLMPRGGGAAPTYIERVLATNPIAYWPLNDAAGAQATELVNGWHGTASGVTWGQTGIGDGETAAGFDGTNDTINIYSAGLAAGFSSVTGTMLVWAQVANVGVWTDRTWRQCIDVFGPSDSNSMRWGRRSTNNSYFVRYTTPLGTLYLTPGGESTTAYMMLALTWDVGANESIAYVDGIQLGVGGAAAAWAGAVSRARIGSPLFWYGNIAHVALWNTALAPATIAALAVV